VYRSRKVYFGFGANSCIKPVKEAEPNPKPCPCGILIVAGIVPVKRQDPERN